MTPERFRQIEELFHAARQKTAEERAALFAETDPELRREVESLLAQATRSGGEFLEQPAIKNDPQSLEDSNVTQLPVGASLGPCRIESRLGKGGMGEVFRAVDTRLGRAVAIKTTREKFSGRFEREARAISSLNHPNICTLYDVGPNYLVMELIEGETLADRLKSGPLPLKIALPYASQILAALAEAHEKGITHRDLKPGNIMIAKSGIKVLDFGLAKSQQDDTLTVSHMVMGTPAYMAPEQKESKPADARSDIYSFGCVLYEILTGERVGFPRKRISSRKLEGIVNRCLEEDPARRWQSAAELERELSAQPAATTRVRRNATTIALATVLVIALGIGGWLLYSRRTPTLTDKDTIVLADFTNTTGDPVFDDTLREGLSVELEQSPFLSLISDQRIEQTLQLMDRKPDARLTPEIAREICQRTGSAAVIEGSIAQIGTPYLLTVKAVDCANGQIIAGTEAQAIDKSHVLDALGKSASEIRTKLGESIGTVQKFNAPLEQATTPSLEALKAYSSGHRVMGVAGTCAADIPFFKQAIELDPNFAVAYAWLGVEYTSIGEPSIAEGYTRKAYELRDRTSEPEKYFISAVYYKEVTGNLPQAVQTCKLWTEAYPRMEMPHDYLAGAIYPVIGEYEKGVEESREAIRLKPESPVPYGLLIFNSTSLNRLDDAKAGYEQALARKLHSAFFPLGLYTIAFLKHDEAGMAQQVATSAGQMAIEDELLIMEAETAAYSGRLGAAREFSHEAIESAERGQEKEVPTTYLAMWALREALFGNPEEAQRRATLAMERSPGVDAMYGSALALAYAGDTARAQALMVDLGMRFPDYTIVQFNYLPTLRAKLTLNKGNASEALASLRAAAPYELGQTTYSVHRWTSLYPVFVRGEAYLAAHQGAEAAAEFQKILDHPGIVVNEPIGALARLQLGRAYALEAQASRGTDADAAWAKARAAYQDFLALWKSADPDIPILNQAKAEFARLERPKNTALGGSSPPRH